MRIILPLLFAAFAVGCLQGFQGKEKVPAVAVSGHGIGEEDLTKIEKGIRDAVLPYPGITYDSINVTAKKQGSFIYLEVLASAHPGLAEGLDIYSFIYDPGSDEFILKGYSLENLPPPVRDDAINVALQSDELTPLLESMTLFQEEPTVKRILPATSEKFYQPKTLFSVTWRNYEEGSAVSALVDLEEGKLLQLWSKAGQRL